MSNGRRLGKRRSEYLMRLHSSLSIVLSKHVLCSLALAMSRIPHNRQSHVLFLSLRGHELLEALRQVLEFGFGGQTGLEQLRLHLNLVHRVLQRGPLQVTCVLLR